MARMARVVVPGSPHHVVQRGNRRQNVFLRTQDKEEYLKILSLQTKLFGVHVWAYCLMDNHVHLIVVPEEEKSLTRAIGETHQLYTRMINFREGWRGYLWQGRFKSTPMDEKYLYSAVRYVERNPVRAKMVRKAEDYAWSSAKVHAEGGTDDLLSHFYLLDDIESWSKYLAEPEDEEEISLIRKCSERGRPIGDKRYIHFLENSLGRALYKRYDVIRKGH